MHTFVARRLPPLAHEPSSPPLLKPVEIAHDRKGRSLSELLANHEIDVIMGTQHPDPHLDQYLGV